MGKDAAKLLVCALASIALIVASLFVVPWFELGMGFSIDLRSVHVCSLDKVCVSVPLSSLPGIYPTAAIVTFWSSLGFAVLVALQAGRRALVGAASDSASKFGYLYALYGMCIAFATGYMFAPDGSAAIGELSLSVDRTWGPAMLLGGFALGFVALHLAIAEDDGVGDFKPVLIAHGQAPPLPVAQALPAKREIPDTVPLEAPKLVPKRAVTDSLALDLGPESSSDVPIALDPGPAGAPPAPAEPETISIDAGPVAVRLKRPTAQPMSERTKRPTAQPELPAFELPAFELPDVASHVAPAEGGPPPLEMPGIELPDQPLELARLLPPSEPLERPEPSAPPRAKRPSALPVERAKRPSGSPLRANIAYAVSTAQLSASSIETKRVDGEARRVLWSEVVGVVVRRLPGIPPYDGATFVDIVSTAGATVRILPVTTVRGESLPDAPDERARALVRIAIKYKPDVHLDGATREFIKGRGPAAQLPDAAALAKHDARLA